MGDRDRCDICSSSRSQSTFQTDWRGEEKFSQQFSQTNFHSPASDEPGLHQPFLAPQVSFLLSQPGEFRTELTPTFPGVAREFFLVNFFPKKKKKKKKKS